MSYIEAIILGIIQGLTEFLPISSSGHLVLVQKLMGIKEAGLLLDTLLHLGTLVAVVVYFWEDIISLLRRPWQRLTWLLFWGTLPTVIIALLFKDLFEELFASGSTLGYEFIATGLVIWLAERFREGYKRLDDMTIFDAIVVGLLQGVAILPAISRSGLTIAGALFVGLKRNAAARYSFLLSIPAILGAVVLQVKDLAETGINQAGMEIGPMLAGTLLAAISGYLAVRWMIALIQNRSLKYFSYYTWFLGISIVIAQWFGKF